MPLNGTLVDHEPLPSVLSTMLVGTEDRWDSESSSSEGSSSSDVSLETPLPMDSPATAILEKAWLDTSSWFTDMDTICFQPTDRTILESSLAWPSQFTMAQRAPESNLPENFAYDAQACWNIASFGLAECGVGGVTSTFSLAPLEPTLSDSLPNFSSEDFNVSTNIPTAHTCLTCQKAFSRTREMEDHAKETKHKPFVCAICNALFSRQDALTRHRELHESRKRYPCSRCEKYQGSYAFKRRDHLRQHLRKAHRLPPNAEFPRHCPIEGCDLSARRGQFDGFRLRKEFSRHMRESHGEEKHDCSFNGCDRKGKKGFSRLNDLERHEKSIHEKLD